MLNPSTQPYPPLTTKAHSDRLPIIVAQPTDLVKKRPPASSVIAGGCFRFEGKGAMRLSFEVKQYDLRLIKCESLWTMFHRGLVKLWKLLIKEEAR